MNKITKLLFSTAFTFIIQFNVSASLISSDLSIVGSIELGQPIFISNDTTFSGNISIGANSASIGGVPGNLTVLGGNTSNIAITDTSQTINFYTLISSLAAIDQNVAYDFGVDIQNNHATDTFTIDFSFRFSHMVSALVTGYSRSNISLYDVNSEFFFSDILSDADFVNEKNGTYDQNNVGGRVTDEGQYDFSYTLLAGEVVNFEGLIDMFFGYSNASDLLEQSSNASLSIRGIHQTQVGQPPVNVPEPSTFLLFLTVIVISLRSQFKGV